jgi:hypothetical protein
MTTPSMSEAEKIAAGLTKASRRALVKIGDGWTEEGSPGPARKDAYSLWWGKDGKKRLVEPPEPYAISQFTCSWKYRLTPLGRSVRAILQRFPTTESRGT